MQRGRRVSTCALFALALTASFRASAHCAGLCEAPRLEQVIVSAEADRLLVRTNFGLLAREGRGWVHFCYEQLGGSVYGIAGHPNGAAIVTADGILQSSGSVCEWTPAGAGLSGEWVVDLASVPRRPSDMVALAMDPLGHSYSVQHSSDGAATFEPGTQVPDDVTYTQVLPSGRAPLNFYLGGHTFSPRAFRISHSEDGVAWQTSVHESDALAAIDFKLLGAAEDDPSLLFGLRTSDGAGDSVFRSQNFGRDLAEVLTLDAAEKLVGFAFGKDSTEIYVAGQSRTASSLYKSSDAGETFAPLGQALPRLSCLTYANGALFACSAELAVEAPFLVARSEDEGRTWQPLLGWADLESAVPCSAEECRETTHALCELYGLCAAATTSGASAASGGSSEASGCSHAGHAGRAHQGFCISALALATLLVRCKRRDRRRDADAARARSKIDLEHSRAESRRRPC
ncbi:MAG TPA: hypothetical protein VK524_24620 [Polyangiaceae bacterium]|nr:hypothetical protein [Polyangiaceae bacterium]